MEIKQIILLHNKKVSNRKIAKRLSMSRNTVNEYVKKIRDSRKKISELLQLGEDELDSLFGRDEVNEAARYTELIKFFPEVLISSKKTGFTFQSMWEQYRHTHQEGYGYTQFLEHYHRWNAKSTATLKLKHKAGE